MKKIEKKDKDSPMQSTEQVTVDEAIALIVSSQGTTQYKDMLDTLTSEQLLSATSDGLDPLTALNPVSHSLAYLYFITARSLNATASNGLQLFELLSHFINVCDVEQVRLSHTRFVAIGNALFYLAKLLKKPTLVLSSFKAAIERFSDSPNAITSLHPTFIHACILAKQYKYPLELLDHDIQTIDPAKYHIDIQGFLEYHYYGAIIYIANKNFDRALDFLSITISAPAQKAISAIQVAAYKKFILASLIAEGKIRTLPRYTAQGVEKVCKTQAAPYFNLAKAFNETDIQLFNEIASKSASTFKKDKHTGLVKQCFQSLRRKKIKEMTKVYITVGLAEMAAKIGDVSPEELELILIEMIIRNQVSASISVTEQHVKMVHFKDDVDDSQLNLEERIFNIAAINDRVAYMNELEGLNRDFQTKYLTLALNGGQLASAYEEEFDHSIDEEDNKAFA